jgi:hypothetical protein
MADLSTLDATSPVGSDALSGADDRIRETRLATKTSFNVEHALAGAHAFLSGNQGARPAAGTAGRIYLNTTDTRLERDTGAAWTFLNAIGLQTGYTAGLIGLTSSYQDCVSVSVDIPTGARLLVIGQCQTTVLTTGSGGVAFNVLGGAQTATPADMFDRGFVGAGLSWSTFFGLFAAPDTGSSVTVKWQAKISTEVVNLTKRWIGAFVF